MALYLDFLIGNPAKQAVYDGVLTRASLEEMWKPVADVESGPDGTVKMGLSFFLEERGGPAVRRAQRRAELVHLALLRAAGEPLRLRHRLQHRGGTGGAGPPRRYAARGSGNPRLSRQERHPFATGTVGISGGRVPFEAGAGPAAAPARRLKR